MTDVNKQAFEQAEKELLDKRVSEVKGYILETLEKIETKKKEKEKIDEELRVLKLDLDDLRSGKFEKIEERMSKSPISKEVSFKWIQPAFPFNPFPPINQAFNWLDNTSGTYQTKTKIYYF